MIAPAPVIAVDQLDWLDKVLDSMTFQHISQDSVVSVIRAPEVWARETTFMDVGRAWKMRRGDIIVTVGLADPEHPMVLHVRRRRYRDEHEGAGTGRSGNAGVHWPRSNRELRKMIAALGYKVRITKNGRGHDDVIDPETNYRITQIACTPGDQNSFEASYRAVLNYHRTSKEIG